MYDLERASLLETRMSTLLHDILGLEYTYWLRDFWEFGEFLT